MHRASRNINQQSFYFAGPGNEDEHSWLGQTLGGAFGWGSDDISDEAIKVLNSVYIDGDKIAVFGFSRGATIARLFCQEIHKNGVNGFRPKIDFLGCFDTVAAFLPFGPSQQGFWHDLHISDTVITACHAVALDEKREAFTPNLMNHRKGIREVWFKGVHSDIGGGLDDSSLSDCSLEWMLTKALGKGIVIDIVTSPDSDATISINEGRWRKSPRRVGVKVNDEWSSLPAVRY